MKLFVGLGNPGEKYARNRHNIGFMAVERIAQIHGFSPWKKKFKGYAADGEIGGEKVLLLKPDTYMNESGQSVGEAARFLKISEGQVVVFHDELDLLPGRIKVKTGGGNAGHNGLRSISAHLGNETVRVRLGIGHPGSKDAVSHFVLSDFAKADQVWLPDLLDAVAKAAPYLAKGDAARFQTDVARLLQQTVDDTGKAKPAKADAAARGPRPPASGGPPGERQSKRASALAENLAKWLAGRKQHD
ncbi:MAG: aminoacyl-tRNA hydrolase [Hyphomicrobium sp.]|nr:aminoacyl-tRNA hydrolase [Hyphomicrobium sp.]